jgi:hypothetical protein
LFAAAKEDLLVFVGFIFHWREVAAFVRAIAKRLVSALTTATPEIGFPCLNVDRHWGGSGNLWGV